MITVTEAAERLRVSRSAVLVAIKRGTLKVADSVSGGSRVVIPWMGPHCGRQGQRGLRICRGVAGHRRFSESASTGFRRQIAYLVSIFEPGGWLSAGSSSTSRT